MNTTKSPSMARTVYKRFRADDWSEARVTLKVFENAEQGLHHVWRYLPAGMDIAPDVWRFEQAQDARNHFDKICADLTAKGFKIVDVDRC